MLALVFAAQLVAQLNACVPARWAWPDAASLKLLDGSPVNCLLMDAKPEQGFEAVARARGVRIVEVEFAARDKVRPGELMATEQGLWPGVKVEKEGATQARPTSAPWVVTNTGYLRFLRALAPAGAAVWMGNRPPESEIVSAQRYVTAIGDAAMSGARWVLAFDKGFAALLRQGDARALESWQRINAALRFYEENRAMVEAPDTSALALVEDASSGALMSGGIVDMIASKHIPLRVAPVRGLSLESLAGARTVLNIDPEGLSDEQKETLRNAARRGASLVNGPPGWRLELPAGGAFTFGDDQVKKLDEVWRGVNGFISGRNFAVRLFGAHSVLSNLKKLGDGRLALHLVNYSDYPVESITIHVAGKVTKATLLTPRGARPAEVYAMEEGTGIEVLKLEDVGILVFN